MKTLANAHDKAELLDRLDRVHPGATPRWGRMSVHQMVCHCADAVRMAIGEKAVSPASNLLTRTLLKWLVLYAPLPWPPGILTRPEIDQQIGGTRPTDFDTDRARLASLLELTLERRLDLHRQAHPIFGRMSDADWLRWSYAHLDHHLRQFGA